MKMYNTLQSKHQPHYSPLDHWRIRVKRFMRQYLLYTSYNKISRLEFNDTPLRFTLELEVPCSWKDVVIGNLLPWEKLPCVPSNKTLDLITHILFVLIQMLT